MPVSPLLPLVGALVLLVSFCSALTSSESTLLSSRVHHLARRGDQFTVKGAEFKDINIFCYRGFPRSLLSLWSAASLRISLVPLSESAGGRSPPGGPDDFELYTASNASGVHQKFVESQSLFSNMIFSGAASVWTGREVRVHPFEDSCLGVLTQQEYTVTLMVYRVNYWLLLLTVIGIFLFLSAERLCRNPFFHYTTGVSVGVALSLLFLAYFAQKRLRAGSWFLAFHSLALYFVTNMWYNVQTYLENYRVYALGYLGVAGAVSFAVIYRMGPVENPRSLNLIQWSMQAFALGLVFFSSYYQAVSLTICLGLLLWINIPASQKAKVGSWYHTRIRRPNVRLLSEAEYMDASRMATAQELEKLRQFCASPKCNTWSVASRLRSPNRFAEFVQGQPHVTENEVMDYSRTEMDEMPSMDDAQMLTDDDSSGSEEPVSGSGDHTRD